MQAHIRVGTHSTRACTYSTSVSNSDLPDGASLVAQMVKHHAGDLGSIPGSGRSPGKENGYPLQYSCLEKPMDRGDWGAIVRGVAKSGT